MMEAVSEHIDNQGRLRNKVIDKFSRSSLGVIIAMYAPLVILSVWWYWKAHETNGWVITGLFIAGMLLWTFLEYIIHRYLYHMKVKSKFGQKLIYLAHGLHHEVPRDRMRLVMPPLPSVFLAITFFGIYYLIFNVHTYAILPGTVAGYLLYLSIHNIVHIYKPPKNFFKTLWIHHHLHHHKYNDKAFGVSSPLWDFIFRTMPPKETKEPAR